MAKQDAYKRLAAQTVFHARRSQECLTLLWDVFKDRQDDYPPVLADLGLLITKFIDCFLIFVLAAWDVDEQGLETYRGITKSNNETEGE